LQKKPTNASSPNVILLKDLSKLLLNVKREINVPKFSAALIEDASTNQLFAMLFLEEHPTNVTQPMEFVNVKDQLVTIKMHVPLIHMLKESVAKTLLNACQAMFVLLQNAINLQELAHLLTRTAMTVTHVPLMPAVL
jgi:hypothetical protein